MAVRTNTTWSADDYENEVHSSAELERSIEQNDRAELSIDRTSKIRLDVAALRDLSKAAALIADEIEASK